MRERALIKVRLRHLNRLKQASSSYQQDFPIGETNSVKDYPRNKNKKVQQIINNNNLERFYRLLPPKKGLKKEPKRKPKNKNSEKPKKIQTNT